MGPKWRTRTMCISLLCASLCLCVSASLRLAVSHSCWVLPSVIDFTLHAIIQQWPLPLFRPEPITQRKELSLSLSLYLSIYLSISLSFSLSLSLSLSLSRPTLQERLIIIHQDYFHRHLQCRFRCISHILLTPLAPPSPLPFLLPLPSPPLPLQIREREKWGRTKQTTTKNDNYYKKNETESGTRTKKKGPRWKKERKKVRKKRGKERKCR